MEVSKQMFDVIVKAVIQLGYVNTTMSASNVADTLGIVLTSYKEIQGIANSTGLTWQTVNSTITGIYLCVNSTIATKNELAALNCFEMATPSKKETATTDCANLEGDFNAMVLAILFCVSFLFLVSLSFARKRKYRRKCCNGRPGAVVPLNMLDSYENRFGNALAFGVTSIYCITVLFGSPAEVLGSGMGKLIKASPGYVSIIFKILTAVVIAMSSYPLFVCMATHHKLLGSIFGIFYSLLWLILTILTKVWLVKSCLEKKNLGAGSKGTIVMEVLTTLPQVVCLILLVAKFLRNLIVAVRKRYGRWNEDADDVYDTFETSYMYRHVLNLLKKTELCEDNEKAPEGFKEKLKKKLYTWHPEFKYSTRVICAITVSTVVLYIITVYLIWVAWFFVDLILGTYVESKAFEELVEFLHKRDISLIKTLRTHVSIWTICFYIAIVCTAIKTTLVTMNMLAWYRRHLMRLRRGDRSWLPSSIRELNASPSSLLAASMKFAGFQVGYVAWGFGIFALLLWLVLSIAVSFIFYPLFHGQSSPLLTLLGNVWPALLVSLIVAFSQRLAAMFFFLQQRGKIISIDNRHAFHITSYFLFYFNIFLGLISCLLRIIKSIIVGVLFLERIQKSLLPRAFEQMDPGFYAYVGYLLIEHSHANPVICVFFGLLNRHAKKTVKDALASQYTMLEENGSVTSLHMKELKPGAEEKDSKKGRWKVARNRWNVAYTLINNPSLLKYRKGYVEKKLFEDDNEDEKEVVENEKKMPVVNV